jgi:hypothetical protein
MAADAAKFLEGWHPLVAGRDTAALDAVLAESVRMGAPPYWNELEGRPLVAFLLGVILHTIDDFTYHREWVDGAELALEFRGRVGDLDLQGIDLITLDASNRIAHIDVLIRPHNAVSKLIEVVRPQMVAFLARQAEATGAAS